MNNSSANNPTKPIIKGNIIFVPAEAKPLVKTSMVWGTGFPSEKVRISPAKPRKHVTIPATHDNN